MTTTLNTDGLTITVDDIKHAILILGARNCLDRGDAFNLADVITRGDSEITLGFFTELRPAGHAAAFSQMCSKAVAELRNGV